MPLPTHPVDVSGSLAGMNGKVKQTVDYVTSDKLTKPAVVLGPGTSSGLRLIVDSKTVMDNVQPATTVLQTGVYRYWSVG